MRVTRVLSDVPCLRKRVYVLIGNEPFESCYRRILQVIEWDCEPHVQPMIALNALTRTPMIRHDWTEQRLHDLARWSNQWLWRQPALFAPSSTTYATSSLLDATPEVE